MVDSIITISKNQSSLCSFVSLLENYLTPEDQIELVSILTPYLNDLIKSKSLSRIFEAIVGRFEPKISYGIRLFIVKNVLLFKYSKDQYFLIKKLILTNEDAQIFKSLCQSISNSLVQFITEHNGSLICTEFIKTIMAKSGPNQLINECLAILFSSIQPILHLLCDSKFSFKILQLLLTDERSHVFFVQTFKYLDLSSLTLSKFGSKLLYHAYDRFQRENKVLLLNIVMSINLMNNNKVLMEFAENPQNQSKNEANSRFNQLKPQFSSTFANITYSNKTIPKINSSQTLKQLVYIPAVPMLSNNFNNAILREKSYENPIPAYLSKSSVNPQLANLYWPNSSYINLFNNNQVYKVPVIKPGYYVSK